ncbi:MAG TPA: D-alanine--D-alanine ligase family protein [Thermoleophilaceae bacterium]|nr:D-alanine--D-alanine ligase family protein [Thermoleophilaceae bacterium]
MRVAVLAGGRSSEHDVSLVSATAVRAGLAEAGHEVVDVLLERDGSWWCGGRRVALDPGGGLLGCEVVWPVLHGPFGEDGTVQGVLELLAIPYVGAGVLASAVAMDKLVFKDLMRAHGVPQVDYEAVGPGGGARMQPPVFVKPSRLGSSVGISKATTDDKLDAALATAFRHDPRVIVEAFSAGMEVECAVLGNDEPEASQPGEIVVNADWYDYDAKYEPGGMDLQFPARLDEAVRERVRELAVQVFELVDCAGLARVDFFVEDGERVLVNELNTMPGFTPTSVYPKLWDLSGLPFPALCHRLVQLGAERHAREASYRF